MITALVTFHIVVCVFLVAMVLLQFGRGAEVGASMGSGSSQSIFTSSQKGNILTKTTTVLAILFMANSIGLSVLKSKEGKQSVFDNEAPVAAPLTETVPATPTATNTAPAPEATQKTPEATPTTK